MLVSGGKLVAGEVMSPMLLIVCPLLGSIGEALGVEMVVSSGAEPAALDGGSWLLRGSAMKRKVWLEARAL